MWIRYLTSHFVILICVTHVLLSPCFLLAQIDTLFICDPLDEIVLPSLPDQHSYNWTPFSSLDDHTIANPTAKPVISTLYIVEQVEASDAPNLIINPHFDDGPEGFLSDYPFSDHLVFTQGIFGVSDNSKKLNGIFFTECYDHTTGDGMMMVIDGSPLPDQEVWCQIVSVKPNTQYAFSTWLSSVNPLNPAVLQFSINDDPLGAEFRATNQPCNWRPFYELWESGTSEVAEICIVNQNTDPDGNDFALDDLGFFELAKITYDSIQVMITAVESAKERRVYTPNIFSPNGDGVNDLFYLPTGKGVRAIQDFNVYNRYGETLYSTNYCAPQDETCGWDGYYNGNLLIEGVYSYSANIVYLDQEEQVIKGTVQLVR